MADTIELSRRAVLFAATVSILSLVAVLAASAGAKEVNVDESGVALHGFDPLAYFSEERPLKGKPEHTAQWNGATYEFASSANRDTFLRDPAKYAPQFGGYCAYGVALGKKFDGDPNVWKIVGGKLYLNVNAEASKLWHQDIPGNVRKAEANWPRIRSRTAAELN